MEFNCGREVEEKVGGKLVLLRTLLLSEKFRAKIQACSPGWLSIRR
jgi:hypothetical protein